MLCEYRIPNESLDSQIVMSQNKHVNRGKVQKEEEEKKMSAGGHDHSVVLCVPARGPHSDKLLPHNCHT